MRALFFAAAVCSAIAGCGAPPATGDEVDQSEDALRRRPPSSGGTTTTPTALPDAKLTPGAVLTTDVKTICRTGYSSTVRNVSSAEKQ